MVRNVVYVGFGGDGDVEKGKEENGLGEDKGEYKMLWMWVEGWRARLRAGGDVVERCRGEDGVIVGERSYTSY